MWNYSKDFLNKQKISILKPEILKKYKLEEEFEFMDKLKNDISQTLKNQEDKTNDETSIKFRKRRN